MQSMRSNSYKFTVIEASFIHYTKLLQHESYVQSLPYTVYSDSIMFVHKDFSKWQHSRFDIRHMHVTIKAAQDIWHKYHYATTQG